MSILIEGMEMPKDVTLLAMSLDGTVDIISGQPDLSWKTLKHKAFHVTPHGRLIDADALYNHLNEWYLTHEHGFSETEKIYIRAMLSGVKDSPTVIPASDEE